MISKKEMGKKIRQARDSKSIKSGEKFTGQMLADELEISRSFLGDLESGRKPVPRKLIFKISKICDIPLSFFGDEYAKLEQAQKDGAASAMQDFVAEESKDYTMAAHMKNESEYLKPRDDEERALVDAVIKAHRENMQKKGE